MEEKRYLTFALTKGRLADKTLSLLESIGLTCEEMKDKSSRKLVFVNEEQKLRFFLAKGPDVPTYVEYGAADIGVVGKDTLLEEGRIELNMADGVILPNLKLRENGEGCSFLNEEGRCSIHAFRPGLCRLFPLGRVYEEDGFHYFLQIHECHKENRSKVKVKKWIGIPEIKRYEAFVLAWHDYLKRVGDEVKHAQEEARMKELTMSVLKLFYLQPYEEKDFYSQFYERLAREKNSGGQS